MCVEVSELAWAGCEENEGGEETDKPSVAYD